ncbi:LuxR C-terminal-related transcriptional regulator [Streptomyces mexicanus]|uniref:LuxR C-terminal-related transcriptional regulator n=1 Tax=Streptomyces mexicanus TaxID=178566 RepID=UPI002E2B0CCC|nr:LuxR C-terminal-related transcriptional regulator [Streptomyces mexicanus]
MRSAPTAVSGTYGGREVNLYGRTHEQWVIRQRLHRIRHGRSNLILLQGPKGYGKTSLVNRISDTARQVGFEVVGGPAAQHKRLLLTASLMAVTTGLEPFSGTAEESSAPHGPDLLDEVLGAGRPAPRGAAARPVLVALDEVAWDDPDVLAALRALPAARSARRVLWLLSGTGGPAAHAPHRHPDTVELTLGPLRRRDALRMAVDRLGGTPDASVERLIAACGGHPGLLTAVLAALTDEGGYRVYGGVASLAASAPPLRVVATLLTADPRLSARTRELLQSVAARQLPPRMSELTHLPDGRAVSVLGAVREAVEAGVLVLDGDRLRFRHPLLYEAAALLRHEPPAADVEGGVLSPTEEAITRLVAAGLTNRQIASRVNLSPHTVNFHLRKIFQKLGVCSRVELVGTRLHLLGPEFDADLTSPTHESRPAHAG